MPSALRTGSHAPAAPPNNKFRNSIAAAHKAVRDANLQDAATTALGCVLAKAPAELQRGLALSPHTHPVVLLSRQRIIKQLRSSPGFTGSWSDRFTRAAAIESEISSFFAQEAKSASQNDLEEDAIAQLSFQHAALKPLNSLPWVVAAIAMFKVWLVPAMTVLMPLLAWVLPYLLLKFVYSLPIDQSQYISILRGLWSGNMPTPFPESAAAAAAVPSLFTPKSIGQFALFAFSFAQSMIQPIQNALHLHKTDRLFCDLGKKLSELRDIVEGFRADIGILGAGKPAFKLSLALDELQTGSDYRRAFLLVVEQPQRLDLVLKDLAALEILWRISQKEEFGATVFRRETFLLEDALDISLQKTGVKKAVPMSLELGQGEAHAAPAHAVLTGPNGGGKSSALRAVLQSVLFSLAYGFSPARRAIMPRFLWLASGLQLRDTPGKYSMFETEVKFAADCLASARHLYAEGPGLVLFDELFHSTNPPDGTRTAKLFLESLWSAPAGSVFSLVSTHVFPLVEAAPKAQVKALCCPAEELPSGDIRYTFRVEPGVCRVSSVKKVWERFGLSSDSNSRAAARPPPNSRTKGELKREDAQ